MFCPQLRTPLLFFFPLLCSTCNSFAPPRFTQNIADSPKHHTRTRIIATDSFTLKCHTGERAFTRRVSINWPHLPDCLKGRLIQNNDVLEAACAVGGPGNSQRGPPALRTSTAADDIAANRSRRPADRQAQSCRIRRHIWGQRSSPRCLARGFPGPGTRRGWGHKDTTENRGHFRWQIKNAFFILRKKVENI